MLDFSCDKCIYKKDNRCFSVSVLGNDKVGLDGGCIAGEWASFQVKLSGVDERLWYKRNIRHDILRHDLCRGIGDDRAMVHLHSIDKFGGVALANYITLFIIECGLEDFTAIDGEFSGNMRKPLSVYREFNRLIDDYKSDRVHRDLFDCVSFLTVFLDMDAVSFIAEEDIQIFLHIYNRRLGSNRGIYLITGGDYTLHRNINIIRKVCKFNNNFPQFRNVFIGEADYE